MPNPCSASRGREKSLFTSASIRRPAVFGTFHHSRDDVSAKRSPRTVVEREGQGSDSLCDSRRLALPSEAVALTRFHADLVAALLKLEERVTTHHAGLQATVSGSFHEVALLCSQLLQHREAMSHQVAEIKSLVQEALMQQQDMPATQMKDIASSVHTEPCQAGALICPQPLPIFSSTMVDPENLYRMSSTNVIDTATDPMVPDEHAETSDANQNMGGRLMSSLNFEKDGIQRGGPFLSADMAVGTQQFASKLSLEEFVALDVFPTTGGTRWNLDQLDRETLSRLSQGITGCEGLPFFQEVIAMARVQEGVPRWDSEDAHRCLFTESPEVVENSTAHGTLESADAITKPRVREKSVNIDASGLGCMRIGRESVIMESITSAESFERARLNKSPSNVSTASRRASSQRKKPPSNLVRGRSSVESMFGGHSMFGSKEKRVIFKKMSLDDTGPPPSIDFNNSMTVSRIMFHSDVNTAMTPESALRLVEEGFGRGLYKEDHWATQLLSNERFIQLNLFVIFLNAVYVGIETSVNATGTNLYASDVAFIVVSNSFCMYFVLDWCFQVAACINRRVMLTHFRPCVETVLVFLTVLDTWLLEPLLHVYDVSPAISPLKVLGILSFARLSRCVAIVPELFTLMRGIAMATRAVFWSLTLVGVFTYMFAVILVTLLESEDAVNAELGSRNFKNIRNACLVLVYDAGLLEEFGTKMTILTIANSPRTVLSCVTMIFYFFLINLTILNLLTGAMLEVVKSLTSETDTEFAISLMRQTILKQLFRFEDGDGLVSRYELQRVLDDDEAGYVLESLNVDRVFLLEMQDLLFPNDRSEVSVAAFTELLLLCRGDNVVTVQIMANGLLYISSLIYKMEKHLIGHMIDTHSSSANQKHPCSEDVIQTGAPSATDTFRA